MFTIAHNPLLPRGYARRTTSVFRGMAMLIQLDPKTGGLEKSIQPTGHGAICADTTQIFCQILGKMISGPLFLMFQKNQKKPKHLDQTK